MIKNIAITGYYWSGSSAVLDLLSEYDNVTAVPSNRDVRDYEHVVFYYGGGLFDLCNHLTHGNTIVGSDYAINVFLDSMKRLYDNNFLWFGSYKHLVGDDFLKITDDLIEDIAICFKGTNYNHPIGMEFSFHSSLRKAFSSALHLRLTNPVVMKEVHDNKKVYMSLPSDRELIDATQKYSRAYMDLFPIDDNGFRLFDHLIWPQQINEFSKFLDPSLKIIVVQRDVRDIFVSNKYLCVNHFFPTDIYEFIELYKKVAVKINLNPNIILINFEDLIYKYDELENLLERELNLEHISHNKKHTSFDPSKSIDNTQIFRCRDEWGEEVALLKKELPEWIYDFPYTRTPDLNKMMDRTA